MNRQDTIAEGVLSTKPLLARYLAGFDESSRTRQAPNLPNHVAWNLGHLALTMHRAAEKIDGKGPPEPDFLIGGHASGGGDARRFATESVSFGSKPADDPAGYPTLARSLEIFNSACDRVAAAVRAAPDRKLDEATKWGQTEIPLYALALRMIFHNGDHVGQIADLRRAFGFKSIFG